MYFLVKVCMDGSHGEGLVLLTYIQKKNSNSNNIDLKLHFEIPELGNVSNVFSYFLSPFV